MMKSVRWAGAAFALAVMAALATAPARAAVDGHFDKTLTVNGLVNLDVTTGSGNITVRPGDSGKVEIHATIRANDSWFTSSRDAASRVQYIEQHPPVEQDGNTITIGHEDDRDLMRNISISMRSPRRRRRVCIRRQARAIRPCRAWPGPWNQRQAQAT